MSQIPDDSSPHSGPGAESKPPAASGRGEQREGSLPRPDSEAPAGPEARPGSEVPAVSDSPAAPPPPGDSAKATKQKKPKRPGRWRRRLIVSLVTILLVVLIFRILLSLLLPWTLRRVARTVGLDCTYERADIYLFSGDCGLWHVRISQLDDNKTIAEAEYCRADISPLQLFRGELVVQRLEADGVNLTLERSADGTFPLLKRLLAGAPAEHKPTKHAPFDLTPPVAIDALRLSHVRTHIIDHSVQPEVDTNVELNLRVSDLASPVRPARLSVEVLPSELLDSVVFESKGTSSRTRLDADFSFSARGLHPSPLAGYLAPLGLRCTAEGLSVEAKGSLHAEVAAGKPDTLTGTLKLQDMAVKADGKSALALRAMTVDLGAVGFDKADITRVVMEEGTFLASRTESGALRVAGLEWRPIAAASSAASHATSPAPSASPPPGTPPTTPYVWTIGELTLRRFNAAFQDEQVTPATNLQFGINDMTVKGIVADPSNPDAPVSLVGHFRAPGIASTLTLEGSCRPFAAKQTLDLALTAGGVRPDALRPYLDAAGIQADLNSGTFTCQLSADVSATPTQSLVVNAELSKVRWADGKELLALDGVRISNLALSGDRIHVDSVAVVGPRFGVRREASGALWAAGFRRLVRPALANSAPANGAPSPAVGPPAGALLVSPPSASGETEPPQKLPKIDITRFTWNGVKVQLDDQAASPPTSVSIEDAGLEITGIHVDFDPQSTAGSQGTIHAWLKAPGLAGTLKLDGMVQQGAAGMKADLTVTGDHLCANLAVPYLKALGIEPVLRDGSLRAGLHAEIAQKGGRLLGSLTASDIRFSDAGEEMFGIDQADVRGLVYKEGGGPDQSPGLLEVGEVTLTRPRGQIVREADGAIRAMGVRLLPKPAEPKKGTFITAVPAASGIRAAADSPAPPEGPAAGDRSPANPAHDADPATAKTAKPTVLVLKKLNITDAAFGWTDLAVSSPARTTAHVKGELKDLTWGRPAKPANLSLTLNVDGIADEVHIDGTASATPNSAGVKLAINASGLREGALASYLPPGVSIELKEGHFLGNLDASAAVGPQGVSATLQLSKISLTDGNAGAAGPALFHLETARVVISRLDLPGAVAIDEISTSGAEASVRRSRDGALHAAGLMLSNPPPATQPAVPPVPAPAPPPAPAAPAPAAPAVQMPPPSSPAIALRPLILEKKKYPFITVRRLDLNLDRLTFADESKPAAAPIVVSGLRLVARKPIEALGDDPTSRAPIDLGLTLRISDVIDRLELTAQVAPFSSQPTVAFKLDATGVRGDGLLALLPELKKTIDASQLVDGHLSLAGEAQLKLDRLDPLDFGMKRGFSGDFLVKDLAWRATKGGPVLAGVDEIRSDGVDFRPATRTIIVNTLEVNRIVGRAFLEADGLHALGMVLKPSPPEPGPSTAPTTQPGASVKSETRPAATVAEAPSHPASQPAASTPPPTTPPAETGEIRIGKLVVSGIDFVAEDRTVSPPLVVPINQFDLDVRGLTTRAMVEQKTVRFSLLIGAGKVPLPHRIEQSAAGLVKDAASIIGGKKVDTEVVMEQRELFSQIQASGTLMLYPHFGGSVKASLSAFDLAALKSEAKRANVELNNGIFDASVEAKLPGDGSIPMTSQFIFTDMELHEPANGPIIRFLRLPGLDLDTVLTVLRDAAGSITVPLNVTVHEGHVSKGDLVEAGVGAFGAIVVKAVASAPLKAAGTATDLAGAIIPLPGLGGEKTPKKEEPVELTFAAGDASLLPGAEIQLAGLLKRMKENPSLEVTLRHELGGGDVARAAARANPSPQECQELLKTVSRRKAELQRLRAELSSRARADLASRPPADAAATIERLHSVERELAAADDALDRLYDLLRPGADRQAGTRTARAALEVARARLQTLRAALIAGGIPSLDARIHLTAPQFKPAGTEGGKVQIVVTVKKQG